MGENGEVLIPVNLEVNEAQRALNKFARKAADTEVEISLKSTSIEQTAAQLEEAKAEAERLQEAVKGSTSLDSLDAYTKAAAKVKELTEALATQKGEMDELKKTAEGYKNVLQTLQAAAGADTGTGGSSDDTDKKTQGLGEMIAGMAKRVFVFSVMTSALRAVRAELAGILGQNKELMGSVAQLRGNILTLINPILNVLIPALTTALQVLNLLISQIGRFLFSILGLSWDKSRKNAEAISKNMAGASKSAKDMQKSLLGIDEINRLEAPSTGGGGGGGASASMPSFDTGPITDKLYEIEAAALGATLALGLILFLSGAKPGLGLALIAAGALGLVAMIKEDWSRMPTRLRRTMSVIMAIASAGLVALGTIMLLSGNAPLGIGMIIAGGALGVSAAALNWESISGKTGDILASLLRVITAAALVLGSILLFAGHAPLGLALIISGLAARQAITPNWNYTTDELSQVVKKIMGIVGRALLVLGLILLASGASIPLGLGLLATSAAALTAEAAFSWDFIPEKIKEIWNTIKAFWDRHIAKIFTVQFWVDKWSAFKTALPQVIKGALNSAITLFNKFIGWINSKMSLSWGDKYVLGQKVLPAGSIRLLPQIGKLPMLAQGAVVPPNNQFLALLGDNKREQEIVSPLSTMKQALIEALRESGGQTVVVNMDGRQLFQVVIDRNNNEVRRTGSSPLLI